MAGNRPIVSTTDYHTGGEPFRIVPDPPVPLPGHDVPDRRVRAIGDDSADGLRRLLCFEPRGHADMYGGFITPPDDEGAHFGVLFWHKDGFSTACGHGTIALGAWAVETGLVERDPSGVTDVRVDVPSGRVTARVRTDGETGEISEIEFVNVPSYALAEGVEVRTSRGTVRADIGFGGAVYAHVRARDLGLEVVPEHVTDLIAVGREIKWLLNDTAYAKHPFDDRLSGIYGTILYDDLGSDGAGNPHQRNVTIFADGQVDRSPCGSGTCSRIAMLAAQGVLRPGGVLTHDSIVGSRFLGRVAETLEVGGYEAVVPVVAGTAHETGSHSFVVDPQDTLVPGFVLR